MKDDWLEPRTRIPFAGIIAMVLIVAVVAVFLNTQLRPFFPGDSVRVTSTAGSQENVAGRASVSFAGLREIDLVRKERLEGSLGREGTSMRFTVDADAGLLTIAERGRVEEVVLNPGDDGMTATFEYDGAQVRVDIDGRRLRLSSPGAVPIDVTLAPVASYEGTFMFNNEEYLFQFFPAGGYALIGARETAQVSLASSGATYAGTWNDGRRTHPVVIDTVRLQATIEEIW